MKPMRRSDRQITDVAEILAILQQTKVCHLAMIDEGAPYVVPLNFGYALAPQSASHATEGLPEALTLYFHSASSGRKIDALRQNPKVSFALDGAHQLVLDEEWTECTYHYHSILGEGEVTFLTDPVARLGAMVAMMQHQSGMQPEAIRAMPRDDRWMQNDALAVIALRVRAICAKRHG